MPIIIILIVSSFLFAVWLVNKLKNSSKFDKIVKNLTTEQPLVELKTDEIINKIDAAEHDLDDEAKDCKKEAMRLQKNAEKAGDFLTKRGMVKTKKRKEAAQ